MNSLANEQLEDDLCFLVTVCGAGHLRVGEDEVPWGPESEVGWIPGLPSLHWGNGSPFSLYEMLPEV